jgi:CHAT domain-containing protein
VTKFLKNFSSNNLSFAKNLHISMKEFIKEDPKNSHPIYWAPFVFVGQDRVVN